MNPIVTVMKAAGYLQGWIAAQNLPQSVVSMINTLIDAAEKPVTQYRQSITLDDDEIERIATLVAARIIDSGVLQKLYNEPEEVGPNPEDIEPVDMEYVEAPDEEEVHDDKSRIREAVRHNSFISAYPETLDGVRCYNCTNYGGKAGTGKYRKCLFYGIGIRAALADRKGRCERFAEAFEVEIPPLRCLSCNKYRKDLSWCTELEVNIIHPTKNMYGVCPHWYHRFKEPMDFSHKEKAIIAKVEKKYAKANS